MSTYGTYNELQDGTPEGGEWASQYLWAVHRIDYELGREPDITWAIDTLYRSPARATRRREP